MKIICKKTVAYNLDLDGIDRDFNITIDREYIVMGMHISNRNNTLYYLTDQDNWPNWYPSQLFEVKDHLLPRDWYTQVYNDRKDYMIYLLIGFKELCMNDDFFDALVEREDFAMQSYFTCKQDLEKRYRERDELKAYGVDEGVL